MLVNFLPVSVTPLLSHGIVQYKLVSLLGGKHCFFGKQFKKRQPVGEKKVRQKCIVLHFKFRSVLADEFYQELK